jgi:tRNA 2-thiouridine synthesizing protein A
MAKPLKLDLRGLKCPLPVLKTRQKLRGLAAGAMVHVETTDPLAVIDIPNYCRQDGHRLVEMTQGDGFHVFVIENRAGSPDQDGR